MPPITDPNILFRDFVRYTGDGLPNEPVGHPAPIGDPSSGVFNIPKAHFRLMGSVAHESMTAALDAADRAEQAASVAASIAGINDMPTAADARRNLVVNADGTGYTIASRARRFIFAYSQSNFAGKAQGLAWNKEPPENLFVWNGGNWSGDVTPPLGTTFLPAENFAPQVPIAYAAEIARSRPGEDWYLVIVARGGTGIRALTGVRYRFRTATSGAPATGDMRLNAGNTEVAYNETDLPGNVRFLGGSDLGTSAFYPARIETTAGGSSWIEFRPTAAATDAGAHRTQPIGSVTSANWPPPDGTDVTVFPAEPRMRPLISSILPAAMNALNLTGNERKIDKLLVWPTEADISYPVAYRDRDFPYLLSFLAPWTNAATEILLTLPWPYGTGISIPRSAWWQAIRDIVNADPARRTLVPLDTSGAEHWGDDNNIHVLDASREIIGTLLAKSEQKGGASPAVVESGFYTPTATGVTNIASSTPFEAAWMRIGQVVTVSGLVQTFATTASAATELHLSLPVASDLAAQHQLSGAAASSNVADHAAAVSGADTVDRAKLTFTARAVTGSMWAYTYSYRVRQ